MMKNGNKSHENAKVSLTNARAMEGWQEDSCVSE